MSKIGKAPIQIPSGVTIEVNDRLVVIKGGKGTLSLTIPVGITVEQAGSEVLVKRLDDAKPTRALHGLVRALLGNYVHGVAEGFSKTLEITGVGYKAEVRGNQIVLNVGRSHPVVVDIIDGVEIKQEKNQIVVSGIDKQRVGHMAALIRSTKKPEPYKGKGIRYSDEVVRRKAGKAAKTA